MERLRRALAQVLAEVPPSLSAGEAQVIDLGCGGSPYRPLFLERGYGYIGCDISGSPDLLMTADGFAPLADGVAEGVVSFQVLEHVWDLDSYLGATDFRRWTRGGLTLELAERGFDIVKVLGQPRAIYLELADPPPWPAGGTPAPAIGKAALRHLRRAHEPSDHHRRGHHTRTFPRHERLHLPDAFEKAPLRR